MQITERWHQRGVALLRSAVGVIFLWAGLDKLIAGGGYWTAAGFLKGATAGSLGWPFVTGDPAKDAIFNPTHGFWVDLAGNAAVMNVVNFLVVFGECAIGVALILGLFTRFAAAMGALMMGFFFVAAWSFSNGIVNQHLTYLIVCLTIAGLGAGNYYGLDAVVGRLAVSNRLRTLFLSGDPTPAVA